MKIKGRVAHLLKNKIEEEEEEGDELGGAIITPSKLDPRVIGLFGEVEVGKAAQIIGMMLELAEDSELEVPENPDDENSPTKIVKQPIEFILNTPGGSADDMFALYDIMRIVKEKCDIETFGIGKVMSAGVLLLASGTKGKRKIGKNCRVMLHSVIGGSSGPIFNLENEIGEMKFMQSAYIQALSDETNMSYKQLKRMIDRKVNVYLSAKEAVELGIADIIV